VGRATNYVSYFLSAAWAGLRLDHPDIVVSLTDPPIIGLAGWLAARRFQAPFVMAYQDLFPEVGRLLDDFHSDAVDVMLQKVNEFLCARATRVVALGDTMRTRLIDNKGAAPERTVVIANWADTSAISPAPRHNAFRKAHGLNEKFVVMHSGNIGLSQDLDVIIEAAALLRDMPDLQFVFQGDGVRKAALQARATELRLSNVCFLPFQPKERLAESFAAADIFIVSLERGLAGYIVPSKIYGIIAAGRPFVAAVEDECEVAVLARQHNCGLVAAPGNAGEVVDKILTLYNEPAMARQLEANARAISAVFDRSVQISRYAELFRQLRPSAAEDARVTPEKRASLVQS
jgi:colanic acid biosynthesis glycosyl transferase WcaI